MPRLPMTVSRRLTSTSWRCPAGNTRAPYGARRSRRIRTSTEVPAALYEYGGASARRWPEVVLDDPGGHLRAGCAAQLSADLARAVLDRPNPDAQPDRAHLLPQPSSHPPD